MELFGDEIDSIKEMNPVTGEITGLREHVAVYPASHYVTSPENMEKAIKTFMSVQIRLFMKQKETEEMSV